MSAKSASSPTGVQPAARSHWRAAMRIDTCRWTGSRGALPSTRTPRASGESGFTLFEVLVAFAVLAIMIVPILQVFGGGLGTTATARAYSTAVLLARSKLAEVGSEENLEEGETTGAFEGYQWRRTISRSELTMAEAEERDQPDDATDSRARKRRESRSFGDRASGRSSFDERNVERRGSFGDSRGGPGDRRGSFGDRRGGRSGFDQRRGGLGRSGQSAFPAGRSGRSEAREPGVGGAGEPRWQDRKPYEVRVTVDWGARVGRETLSLSTLRLGRPADDAETSRR